MGDRGKAETLKAETLKSEIGNRGRGRSHIFWFRLLHRGLPSALLCAAASLANPFGVSVANERPRRLVIGHVLRRGQARNGAADHASNI